MSIDFEPGRVRVGEWLVEPELDRIVRADEVVKLEPRMMRLLLRLAATPGQVVSSQQLLDEVWSGVVVGSASVYQAVCQLRKLLGDAERSPDYIATVPRKGYRLIAAVVPEESAAPPSEALHISSDAAAPAGAPRPAISSSLLLFAACIVIASLAALAVLREERPIQASIIVLPFVDLSSGLVDAQFCDALTEEVSSSLSQLPRIHVISRTTAYVINDQQLDVRDIGRKLRVMYVLEGSVQRTADALRVNARLVEAHRRTSNWAASYEIATADLEHAQTHIAREVARAVQQRFATPDAHGALEQSRPAAAD